MSDAARWHGGAAASCSGGGSDQGSWATRFATGAGDQDPLLRKLFRIFLLFTDELADCTNSITSSSDCNGSTLPADGSLEGSVNGSGEQRVDATRDKVLRRHALTAAEVRILCALFAREIGLTELPSTSIGASNNQKSSYVQWTCAQCSCELRKAIPDYPQLYTFRNFIWALGRQFPHQELFEASVDALLDRIGNQVLRKGFIYVYRKTLLYKDACDLAWCMLMPGKLIFWPVDSGDPRKTSANNRKEYQLTKSTSVQVGQRGNLYAPLLSRLRSASSRPLAHRRSSANRPISLVGGAFVRSVSPFAESAEKLEAEVQRRRELQRENRLLQELLDKERQSARDEEIVREVATRMLDEERTLREAAEERAQQQQAQLALELAERERREGELRAARLQLSRLADDDRRRREEERMMSEDRERMFDELKRDHEALMHQLALKDTRLRGDAKLPPPAAAAAAHHNRGAAPGSELAVFYVRPHGLSQGVGLPQDSGTGTTVCGKLPPPPPPANDVDSGCWHNEPDVDVKSSQTLTSSAEDSLDLNLDV